MRKCLTPKCTRPTGFGAFAGVPRPARNRDADEFDANRLMLLLRPNLAFFVLHGGVADRLSDLRLVRCDGRREQPDPFQPADESVGPRGDPQATDSGVARPRINLDDIKALKRR